MNRVIRYVTIEEPTYDKLQATLDKITAQLESLIKQNAAFEKAIEKLNNKPKIVHEIVRPQTETTEKATEQPGTYLSMEDLKKYLNLSDVTIYRFMKWRDLPTVKLGNQRRFIKADIDAWVKKQNIR
jgi:excisionase family DNA binding protein